MKNVKKLIAMLMAVSVLAVFSGCGANLTEPEKSANEVISEGVANLMMVTSGNYDVTIDAKGETAAAGVFDVSMEADGVFNEADAENSYFSLSLDVDGEMRDQMVDMSAEFRSVAGAAYVILEKIPEMQGMDQAFGNLVGQWWSFPAEAGVPTIDVPAVGSTELTPEQQDFVEQIKMPEFFKSLEYMGSEQAGGVASHHYKGVLSDEFVSGFVEGFTGMATDDDMLEVLTEGTNMELEVWVGGEDMTLHKVVFVVSVAAETESLDGKVVFELSDLNEDLTVEAPADVQELDPMMLLPAMMMMSGGMEGGEPVDLSEGMEGLEGLE